MGFKDSGLWLVIGSAVAVALRTIQIVVIARLALRDTKPVERGRIIESLSKTRQFSPLPLPRRRTQAVARTLPDDVGS
jgi:hypothetical protein